MTLLTALLLGAPATLQAAGRKEAPAQPAPVPVRAALVAWDEPPCRGLTSQDAEKFALNEAARSVQEYLSQQYPGLGWVPSVAYLRRTGIVNMSGPPVELTEDIGVVYEVKMRVEISQEQMKDMLLLARQQRQQLRHRLAGWVLLGVVLLLAVGIGYLRLEDATRGHLTGTLRVGAIVVAALIVGGIWWFAQT
jgi:hypothetical protein